MESQELTFCKCLRRPETTPAQSTRDSEKGHNYVGDSWEPDYRSDVTEAFGSIYEDARAARRRSMWTCAVLYGVGLMLTGWLLLQNIAFVLRYIASDLPGTSD